MHAVCVAQNELRAFAPWEKTTRLLHFPKLPNPRCARVRRRASAGTAQPSCAWCGVARRSEHALAWLVALVRSVPIIFHGVVGKDEREGQSPSWFNAMEAKLVVECEWVWAPPTHYSLPHGAPQQAERLCLAFGRGQTRVESSRAAQHRADYVGAAGAAADVLELRGLRRNPVAAGDIGIISPYRRQVRTGCGTALS